MKPYNVKALDQFNNTVPLKHQDSPFLNVLPKFGQKQRFTEQDTLPTIGKAEQKHVQTVNGKFLWYAQAVDGTLLTLISALTAQQSKLTQKTMKQLPQLLDYCTLQEPVVLTY